MIGTEIHNYRITGKIGEGGMATVYKAVHKNMHEMVRAIKMLHPMLGIDAGIKTKFVTEAKTMATLDHPNIVKILDYEEVNGNMYLVMEYLDGMNIEELIRQKTGPIPEARVVKIFSKVLDAIGYAHSKGIIHRDIKPSNIIIGPNDEPKIIDFGIVKILEDDNNPGKTKTGTKIGTPLYMSPEQILAKGVDKRSDIYGLGVTLFQMITGQAPYTDTVSEYEILTKIVNEPLPRVREMYPAASERIQIIIDKATAKKKDDRYSNCEEFAKDLNGEGIVREPGVTQTVNKQNIAGNFQPTTNKKKSNYAVWIAVAVVFAGLIGFGLYKVSKGTGGSNEVALTDSTPVYVAAAPPPSVANSHKPQKGEQQVKTGGQGRFPQASRRLLSSSDLNTMSKEDLKIMRNEIFARHGYIFRTADMKEYFSRQPWYYGQYDDVTSMLSEIEKQNISTIKNYE